MRINAINPKYLTDQHLIAEYRELLMATKALERNQHTNSPIPKEYRLGTGHVNFFKNKIGYLKKRHVALKNEMTRRGFTNRHNIHSEVFPENMCNDWKPSKKDRKVSADRIYSRIMEKPQWYRYCGKYNSPEFYLALILKGISKN